MRVISFNENQKDEFSLLYTALYGSEKKLTAGEFRTLVKVLDKADAISEKGETDQHPRQLIVPDLGVQQLALEDTEYDLVKGLVNETAWTVRTARVITKLYDLIDSAVNPEAKKE